MGQRTRIVILQSEKLLTASVQSLLSKKENVDLIAVRHSDESFASILKRTQPDIVIMGEQIICDNMSNYLEILKEYPDVRTIVLRLGDNQMHVYDKRIVQVERLNDFFDQL